MDLLNFFWSLDVFTLKSLGALCMFIYGMKVMSEGIQKAAGGRMRKILGAMTRNRYLGLLTGALITGLVQSSSVTTVMTVSFVNAGLITLIESVGVMMGANIGTTITGWLLRLSYGFNISDYALIIVAFGLPMMFIRRLSLDFPSRILKAVGLSKGSKKQKARKIASNLNRIGIPLSFLRPINLRHWGEFLVGFAILFLGLDSLKESLPDIQEGTAQYDQLQALLAGYSANNFSTTLLFVLLGTVMTIILQSSSVAMALTVTLCTNGVIPFELAALLILGENIGTTITANIAALIANVHAKRSALIHLIFNLFGVTWMLFVLNWFLDGVHWLNAWIPLVEDNAQADGRLAQGLAIFHTTFNVLNVLLLIWFVPLLARLATRLIKSRGHKDERHSLEFLTSGVTDTAELSLVEARTQVRKFGEIVQKMHGFSAQLLMGKPGPDSEALVKRVSKYEKITDRVEVEIADYLLKLSGSEMSATTSLRVRSMLSIIGELEQIGDIVQQMALSFDRKRKERSWFTVEQRGNLLHLFELLDSAFDIMVQNLSMDYDRVDLTEAQAIEKEIKRYRKKVRKQHYQTIESGQYNIRSGLIYSDLYNAAVKIGDHITHVSEAVAGKS